MVRLGPTFAQIDLGAIEHNFREIRSQLPESVRIMAVVKADAYGHGAVEVTKRLIQAGANYFAVANLAEGESLRLSGINAPILLLSETVPELADEVIRLNLTQTVYTYEMAKTLSEIAKKENRKVKIHIKIDTGMNRIGMDEIAVVDLVKQIRKLPNLEIEGVFTHFSNGEEENLTKEQLKKFNQALEAIDGHKIPMRHAANSAATLSGSWGELNMIRIGLTLYGLYPEGVKANPRVKLRPALAFKTKVVYLKKVPAGTPISYGGTYRTKQATQIATLPVGYADGFSRGLSNKGKVVIRGKIYPVVGRVCMDLTLVEAGDDPIAVGDEVYLIGRQGNAEVSADEVAHMLSTINYEIVCSIGKRVPRVYIG